MTRLSLRDSSILIKDDAEYVMRSVASGLYFNPDIDQFTEEYGISGLELIPDSGNTR